jgi:hypothetical protein
MHWLMVSAKMSATIPGQYKNKDKLTRASSSEKVESQDPLQVG